MQSKSFDEFDILIVGIAEAFSIFNNSFQFNMCYLKHVQAHCQLLKLT